MSTIHQLPPNVVNKIAAGEVIERPASVAKELLENAIDAGATRIDVEIRKGGAELIRVADNGCGLAPEDIPLAVAQHATSKIRDADDLFRVATLGFRGEALASIAEVSRLLLRSRPADAAAGCELEVHGGRGGEATPCACAPGTSVAVSELFFNTPVRRKFLRTTQTEMGHITEAVIRVALAYPEIQFTLRHNERLVHELPATDSWLQRIAALFGDELAENLIEVASVEEDVRLVGYVAHPSFSRGNQRQQYLLLNGRFIRDRSLQHALGEAYRGLLMTGRYPIAFLRLTLPAEAVDVNVHPTKLEVRFQDAPRLYSHLLGTLRTRFLSANLQTRLHAPAGEAPLPSDAGAGQRGSDERWAGEALARRSPGQTIQFDRPPSEGGNLPLRQPLALEPLDASQRAALLGPRGPREDAESAGPAGAMEAHGSDDEAGRDYPHSDVGVDGGRPESPGVAASQRALQIHNRYLVAEGVDGLVVIDQHALHERILYEQLRETMLAGPLPMQRLLVPEPVDLSAAEAATVLEQRELLAQLGIVIEEFGGDTILVSGYPALLANMRPVDMLRSLIERLQGSEKSPEARDLADELLHTMACKAAIKAGDHLTPEEIHALLDQRHRFADTHHCPHGRPTELVLTRSELDKQFKRT